MSDSFNNNGLVGGNTFSPREIIIRYVRYFPLIAISIVLFLAGAYIKIRYTTPIYKVNAKLLVKKQNSYGDGNDKYQDIFMMAGSSQNLNDEKEIIKSRPMAARVVKSLGLQLMVFNIGSIRNTLINSGDSPFNLKFLGPQDSSNIKFNLPIIILNDNEYLIEDQKITHHFGEVLKIGEIKIQLNRSKNEWRNFASNQFVLDWAPLSDRAAGLSSNLGVDQANDFSNVLELSYQTENTKWGLDILNQYMMEYQESSLEEKREIAQNTLTFINQQLDTVKFNLGGVERNLQLYREQNQVFDPEQQSQLTFGEVSTSTQQITQQEVKLKIIDFLVKYIQDIRNPYRTVPATLGIEEPSFIQQVTEFNQAQLSRERSLKTIPQSNPLIKDLETSIERLRGDMLINLANIRQTYQLALNKLNVVNGQAQSQIKTIPRKQKQMLEVTRQQNILQDLYSFLLQKQLETAISSASTISNIRILEPAFGSTRPISPNKKSLYLFAIILGIALPAGIILLVEFLNDKVKTKQDVEKYTKAPILGEVGHAEMPGTLVVSSSSRQFIAEQFRIIRSNLKYILPKIEKPVIMVTSSFNGEGKSFISTNLGAVLAISGKITVILEFDIRKPKIMEGLGLKERKGITNYIVGNVELTKIIYPVPQVENLFVIPCGLVPPNPAEMLLDERVKELFEELRERFDAIIIDTAPVGLVSDAITLGNNADAVVYVVRHNYTLKKQIGLVEELYSKQMLPHMAVVINDILNDAGYGGYYGYGYGYGYGYKSDYFEKEMNWKMTLASKLKFWK